MLGIIKKGIEEKNPRKQCCTNAVKIHDVLHFQQHVQFYPFHLRAAYGRTGNIQKRGNG